MQVRTQAARLFVPDAATGGGVLWPRWIFLRVDDRALARVGLRTPAAVLAVKAAGVRPVPRWRLAVAAVALTWVLWATVFAFLPFRLGPLTWGGGASSSTSGGQAWSGCLMEES